MKLSIIIVNFNTADLTCKCIESVYAFPPECKFEIVIIDNKSMDNSVVQIKRKYRNVVVIKNKRNEGFAKANNRGALASLGEYLLFLNSDTLLIKDSLNSMIDIMERNYRIGILGPFLIDENNSIIQMSWGWIPYLYGEVMQKALSPKNVQKFKIVNKVTGSLQKGTFPVPIVAGACMMVRRDCFNDIKGFDENFIMYFEEPDICYRALKKGWKVFFTSDAKVIHMMGQSSKKNYNRLSLIYRQSQIYFYKKNGSLLSLYLLTSYLLIKFTIGYLFYLVKYKNKNTNLLYFYKKIFLVIRSKEKIVL